MGEGKREEGRGVETNILFYKKIFKKRILSVRLHVSMWLTMQNLSLSLPCICLCLVFFFLLPEPLSLHISNYLTSIATIMNLYDIIRRLACLHTQMRGWEAETLCLLTTASLPLWQPSTASLVLYSPDTMLSGTLLPIWWQSNKTHTEEGWKLAMHKVHIKSQKHE